MRRLLTTFVLALLTAATIAGVAGAKEMSIGLASGPPTLDPGEPWNGELLVHGGPDMLAEAAPAITFRNRGTGETKTFDGVRAPGRAPDGQLVYRVRVVLPEGAWEWGLVDGLTDRLYDGGLLQVGEPAASAPTASGGRIPAAGSATDGGLPTWPLVAGGVAFLLLAGAAARVVGNRRLQPTS